MPDKPRTPLMILEEVMQYASVRHSLGLNHTYERGCPCLRCEADEVIEKFLGARDAG